MKTSIRVFTGFAFAILIFFACKKTSQATKDGLSEANELLATAAE
jgi:hypothetical protein